MEVTQSEYERLSSLALDDLYLEAGKDLISSEDTPPVFTQSFRADVLPSIYLPFYRSDILFDLGNEYIELYCQCFRLFGSAKNSYL